MPTTISGSDGVDKVSFSFELKNLDAVAVGNDLVITVHPSDYDFRLTTLTDGTPVKRRLTSAVTLTIPNGATLGSINTVEATYVVGLQDNNGTLEPFVINLAGGNQLDESNLITTTSISTGADSKNVAYATVGRSNLAYRIVGLVRHTQATAGTYATQPTLVQPCGAQALTALSSLGYGQTWQTVTRALGTTYYNITGKPIELSAEGTGSNAATASIAVTINGIAVRGSDAGGGGSGSVCHVTIPAGASYVVANNTGSFSGLTAKELR